MDTYRRWTHRPSGNWTFAKLVGQTGDEVELVRQDGETLRIKRADLSEEDQAYLDGLNQPEPESGGTNGVVLTDVQIPFGRMVMIILKWMLASIPAALLMWLALLLLTLVFGAGLGGCAALMAR